MSNPTAYMTRKTGYFNFFCCGDNEFEATYPLGELDEFFCTTCNSVYRVAHNTEGEN